jgi:hypothetical protein
MLVVINQNTNSIESITTTRTENNRPLTDVEKQVILVEKPKPPLKAFPVTDDELIFKLWEVLDCFSIIKKAQPVFDNSGNLKDVDITYFDIGEDREL